MLTITALQGKRGEALCAAPDPADALGWTGLFSGLFLGRSRGLADHTANLLYLSPEPLASLTRPI